LLRQLSNRIRSEKWSYSGRLNHRGRNNIEEAKSDESEVSMEVVVGETTLNCTSLFVNNLPLCSFGLFENELVYHIKIRVFSSGIVRREPPFSFRTILKGFVTMVGSKTIGETADSLDRRHFRGFEGETTG
jgi:hypothetical protein